MRVLIIVRIAALLLVNVGACFGFASHTRHKEMADTKFASEAAATNGTILKTVETIDEALGKDKSSFNGKDNEARGSKLVDFFSQSAVHVVDQNLENAEAIEVLARELLKELGLYREGYVFWMKREKYWRLMEAKADGWLHEHTKPQTVFSYLEPVHQGTDLVTIKNDPKLIFWFHYITKYRLMNSMDSNYAPFNNKELLNFLAEHIRLQNGLKLTLSPPDQSLVKSYPPVVSLFDSYRNEPGMEDFAADMLAYMVTDPNTKDLVLDNWLLKKVSPVYIFKDLRLNNANALIGTDDVTLFTVWLNYVKKYLHSGALDFDMGSFIEVQLSIMLMPRAKVMFESNALENVLGDVRFQTGNLAAYVRDIWQRFPQDTVEGWGLLSQKTTSGDSYTFVKAVSSIASYVESKPFNGDQMFDLLNPKYSLDEVVRLFQELERKVESIEYLRPGQHPIVKKYAHSMVQYLSDSSSMLRLSPLDMHPESRLNNLIKNNADVLVFKHWFPVFVAYYRRVKKKSIEEAIIDVIHLLQIKLPYTGDSSVSWLTIVNELKVEDVRIDSAFKLMQHTAMDIDY